MQARQNKLDPEAEAWFDAVDRGIKIGVSQALRAHKEEGVPIVVWENGEVVTIPPEEIPESALRLAYEAEAEDARKQAAELSESGEE